MIRILLSFFLVAVSFPAKAAEMRLVSGSSDGLEYITILGEFEPGDDQKFIRIALPIERAVVAFNSDGGNLLAGLGIGRAIRLKEFSTLVPTNSICASACGLAWLAGLRRFLDAGAKVGFHAAYIQSNNESKETGMGNALAGAYLSQLGLTQSAIANVTEAAPENMKWLTPDDAKNVGIEMTVLASNPVEPDVPKVDEISPPKFPTNEQPSQAMKRVQSADIFGFDLPNMPSKETTLTDCEQACEANSDCKAYTFNRPNSACFLKSNGSRVLGNHLADAGYKIEIEARLHASPITVFERTDLPGGDYKNISDMTFEQCTDSCETDKRCASFTYTRRTSTCWLKWNVPTARQSKIAISGVKAPK